MTTVSIKNMSKRFGDFLAVKSINLEVGEGEFIVLLGPSGCGKTTTLRMIAGLEDITSGELSIGGRNVGSVPGKDRDIAMVFQSYALYPHKTVRQNLAFALELKKTPKAEIKKKVENVAITIGLGQLLDRKPKNLSGGQQQRVALGRAMVRDPAVFLFDEPLSNLDAKLRGVMRAEITKLHRSVKATMIYVTHDQVEAMTMADRIVVMSNGLIEQIGTPLEVYDNPNSVFVASFIGTPAMNIFPGTIINSGKEYIAQSSGFKIALKAAQFETLDAELQFGVRPEFITISHGNTDLPQAEILALEQLGSETIAHVSTDGPKLTVKAPRLHGFGVGDRVSLEILPENIFAFDQQSGARIGGAI